MRTGAGGALRQANAGRWRYGGWLRLEPTPAGEIGSQAADRSPWGQWQRRLHRLQSAWDDYVMEMDRQRQQEAVYQPLLRSMRQWLRNLRDPQWWRSVWGRLVAALGMGWSGVGGALAAAALLLAAGLLVIGGTWWGLCRGGRLWRAVARRGPAPPPHGAQWSSTAAWSTSWRGRGWCDPRGRRRGSLPGRSPDSSPAKGAAPNWPRRRAW